MAKLSLRVFKQGKPIYWIVGGVVVFVVFYMLFNKGGANAGSGNTSYVSSGPSEALQAAQLQTGASIQAAQIAANVEAAKTAAGLQEAQMGQEVALAQTDASRVVSLAQLANQSDLASINANTNLLINEQNLSYAADTAKQASQTQIALKQIDAATVAHQLDTNADMFKIQSQNLLSQSLISQIGNVAEKKRYDALVTVLTGMPAYDSHVVPINQGGGVLSITH